MPKFAKIYLFLESTNFKQKKAAQQKSQAGSSHNWNTLFLGHDAVAEVIADNYDIAKETVLGTEGKGSAAVRLAIGETQIVTQTRKYLEKQGVMVDVFNTVRICLVFKSFYNKSVYFRHRKLGQKR